MLDCNTHWIPNECYAIHHLYHIEGYLLKRGGDWEVYRINHENGDLRKIGVALSASEAVELFQQNFSGHKLFLYKE